MISAWQWINAAVVLAIHDEQLAEHGGRRGIRDIGLLHSALARARHKASYGKPDVAQLAAAYAFGIIKGHPFVDCNKRTALVVLELFLLMNGYRLVTEESEILDVILGLARGKITEKRFENWIRARLRAE